jgi:hypothetical protein
MIRIIIYQNIFINLNKIIIVYRENYFYKIMLNKIYLGSLIFSQIKKLFLSIFIKLEIILVC